MSVAAQFERNLGFVTEAEQERLGQATVAIAGAGGDGGELAVSLARMGIGAQDGEIRLADPDTFEVENINRQACSTMDTVGRNKAEVVGSYINRISPDTKVITFTEGITHDNVDEFTRGADLLIDETEFTLQAIGIALAREARRHRIPNLQVINVGFGAQVTSYDGEGKFTMEKRLGLQEDMSLKEIARQEVSVLKWLAEMPNYADLAVFKKVASGQKSVPTIVSGVNIAAGIASSQALLHLLGSDNHRPKPVFAPVVLSMDAMTGKTHLIKHPRARITFSMLNMVIRNRLGRNPHADY